MLFYIAADSICAFLFISNLYCFIRTTIDGHKDMRRAFGRCADICIYVYISYVYVYVYICMCTFF